MRTISIQADKANDQIMTDWLAHLVVAIPVGGEGLKFDGDLHDGTIVNHRQEGVWSVSFRPSPGGSNARRYASPYAVVRAIVDWRQNDAALGRQHLEDTGCDGLTPAPGSGG